jgi:hypothetical protein
MPIVTPIAMMAKRITQPSAIPAGLGEDVGDPVAHRPGAHHRDATHANETRAIRGARETKA